MADYLTRCLIVKWDVEKKNQKIEYLLYITAVEEIWATQKTKNYNLTGEVAVLFLNTYVWFW